MFYRSVARAVLIFGSKTWVILAELDRKIEGIHMSFLRHITGKQSRQKEDGICNMPRAEVVQEAVVNQS